MQALNQGLGGLGFSSRWLEGLSEPLLSESEQYMCMFVVGCIWLRKLENPRPQAGQLCDYFPQN